jgi:tight adherence protein B
MLGWIILIIVIVLALSYLRIRQNLLEEADRSNQPLGEGENYHPSFRAILSAGLARVTHPLARGTRKNRLQLELNRAGINLKSHEFIAIQLFSFIIIEILVYRRFNNYFLAGIGALLGYLVPMLYVRRRQYKRSQQMDLQLPDIIRLLSSGIKAGYSVPQALVSVAENGRQPLASEFARIMKENSLGVNLDLAISRTNERLNSQDFDMLVVLLLLHLESGGNLVLGLDNLAETIRDRVKLQREIRILTAQAKGSGYIITALPFAAVALLSFVSPHFEQPMFETTFGWELLGLGLVMIIIGYLIMRRITDISL